MNVRKADSDYMAVIRVYTGYFVYQVLNDFKINTSV